MCVPPHLPPADDVVALRYQVGGALKLRSAFRVSREGLYVTSRDTAKFVKRVLQQHVG